LNLDQPGVQIVNPEPVADAQIDTSELSLD